jgi:hypothetical protein
LAIDELGPLDERRWLALAVFGGAIVAGLGLDPPSPARVCGPA